MIQTLLQVFAPAPTTAFFSIRGRKSELCTATCLNIAEPVVNDVHPDANMCVRAVEHMIRLTPFASVPICLYSPVDALLDCAQDLRDATYVDRPNAV